MWIMLTSVGLSAEQVFLFTASNPEAVRDWNKTIVNTVSIDMLSRYLGRQKAEWLMAECDGKVYAWGATRNGNNPRIWSEMRKREGNAYIVGYQRRVLRKVFRIVFTWHDEKFAKKLWGVSKRKESFGLTWEYMYFLQHLQDINEPSPRVFRGHTWLNHISDRATRLKIISIVDEAIRYYETLATSECESKLEHGIYYVPDHISRTKVRIYQNLWRRKVLENFNYRCCVCGLSIEKLLEAAHIVEWSKDPYNRLNPYNGLCLCSIHHKAFDLGWLIIDESLTIHWKPPKDYREIADEAIYEYFMKYDGRPIITPKNIDIDRLKEFLRRRSKH
ncbi:hypothetical protein DRO64_07540 [Candidatus Bathyarchaeota archaeon]|nr:MAG: hypothetical protein DRO64_07540 [Candidatus Bathyarchaeota archaeon]